MQGIASAVSRTSLPNPLTVWRCQAAYKSAEPKRSGQNDLQMLKNQDRQPDEISWLEHQRSRPFGGPRHSHSRGVGKKQIDRTTLLSRFEQVYRSTSGCYVPPPRGCSLDNLLRSGPRQRLLSRTAFSRGKHLPRHTKNPRPFRPTIIHLRLQQHSSTLIINT